MSRIGRQTIKIERPVYIRETAAIVGVKEGEGPLSEEFDEVLTDDTLGEKTWEKSESALQKKAAYKALDKAGMKQGEIDYALAGDLINQCIGAHYSMRDMDIPFLGLYGACSTMTESLSIGSMLIGGGFANNVMCLTSSHFCTAEKQFRNPLEYGGQRTPSAQWTVTGSGCAILSAEKGMARITAVTSGKVIDKGINDLSNMGAAMAPAAIDTL
ncbi:MAG: stage V sporulation protein AD, partial [Clostridia bacterium]|nr:stage V sporulation protein AD [Clostridia bacterium]